MGEKLYEGRKPAGHRELTVRTGSVLRQGKVIGNIEMALTPRAYQEMTRYLVNASILIILAALAVVVGVTHIMVKSFLGRPLQYLYARMDRIANGDYGYDPSTYRQAEIQSILSKFNEMAVKIEARENNLADLNVRLKAEILEREHSEQQLRTSEERFRTYFEHSLLPMAMTLPNKSWDKVNDRLIDLLGYSGEELSAMNWAELTHPEDLDRDNEQFERMLSGEIEGYSLEKRFIHKSGAVVFTILSVGLVRKPDGSPGYILAQVQDISDRKRAEEALRNSEAVLRSLLEATPVGVALLKERVFVKVNPALCRITGYSDEEMIGMFTRILYPDDEEFARVGRDGYRQMEREGLGILESRLKRKDGAPIQVMLGLSPFDPKDLAKGVTATVVDITDRKLAEEEMRRLRNYLSNIINSMPSMLIGVDAGGCVTHWNAAAAKATGIEAESALSQPLEQVLPMLSQRMDRVRQAMRSRTAETETKVPRVVGGETRYEDVTIYPLITNGVEGAVIRVDDVTDRMRIEEMMIQSEKMLSVGGLAAGMAHEINNPLGAILQASQNIMRRVSAGLPANARVAEACGTTLDAVRQYLDQREIILFLEDIRSSGLRAAQIVENMLAFSRKPDVGGSSTDLADLLDRTLQLAGSDYDLKKRYDFRQIEIDRDYAPELPLVVCQASKIQQVFLNILRNGAEAMGERRNSACRPRFVLRIEPEGPMVRVEIEDNGPGIEDPIRRRIFEPFFTTKPPGVGTGLGMSVSYFIITEDHGGTLSVESSPSVGTRFIIRLPIAGKAQ